MVLKSDRASLSFGEELSGFGSGSSSTVMWLGIVPGADLPDPEIDFQRRYAIGANRDPLLYTEGKHSLGPTTFDVDVQNGRFLKYFFGDCSSQNGATSGTYKHTMVGKSEIPSIQLDAAYLNTDSEIGFTRNYVGMKVNSVELKSDAEGLLTASIEVIGSKVEKNRVSAQTVTALTTGPYIFHHGSFEFWGATVSKIVDFSLRGNNQLKAKWYIRSPDGKYAGGVYETAREYELDATVDIDNDDIFDNLINASGCDAVITFTNPEGISLNGYTSSYLKLTCAGCVMPSAPHGIPDDKGEVPVAMKFLPKSVSVEEVNGIQRY